jgi:hypothetical protein
MPAGAATGVVSPRPPDDDTDTLADEVTVLPKLSCTVGGSVVDASSGTSAGVTVIDVLIASANPGDVAVSV